jgi:hypothetical protein
MLVEIVRDFVDADAAVTASARTPPNHAGLTVSTEPSPNVRPEVNPVKVVNAPVVNAPLIARVPLPDLVNKPPLRTVIGTVTVTEVLIGTSFVTITPRPRAAAALVAPVKVAYDAQSTHGRFTEGVAIAA